jgi:hypothetical protein
MLYALDAKDVQAGEHTQAFVPMRVANAAFPATFVFEWCVFLRK